MKTLPLPEKMKALVLETYRGAAGLSLQELPVVRPKGKEVLVRVMATPINPSDLMFLHGHNPIPRRLPSVPGFEGAGEVVATGAQAAAKKLLGKRVAVRAKQGGHGTWAEYILTDVDCCIPLANHVSWSEGATLLVNPLTAWALVVQARQKKHQAAIQTAASSALCKMNIRLAREMKFPLINIVHKDVHVESLKKLGAKWVLNSSAPGFVDELTALAHELKATVAFDAVAGELSNTVLKAMPRHSELWSYGGLSQEPCKASVSSLVYEEKSVVGFWGPVRVFALGPKKFAQVVKEIQKKIKTVFQTEFRPAFRLDDFATALREYEQGMSKGKVIFEPAGNA